jgi:hypothetical protein
LEDGVAEVAATGVIVSGVVEVSELAFAFEEGRGGRWVVRCAGFSLVVTRLLSLPGTLQKARALEVWERTRM